MTDVVTTILTSVTNMKRLKILPGAAGLIALTATIGFVDGQHKVEADSISRGRITLVSALTNIAAGSALPGKFDIKPVSPAYRVEIKRGNTFAEVLIDAVTGRILSS